MIINKERRGKLTSESAITGQKIEFFDDKAKSDEVIFGGRVLNIVNDIAKTVAMSHCEGKCETISVDFIRYYSQIKSCDILFCKAQVNRVWENIIEVGTYVAAEDFRTLEQKKILSAYFLFIVEKDLIVPDIIPETSNDKIRFVEAEKRHQIRLKRKLG